MRAFTCPRCGQVVFFENSACLRCGASLAYSPDRREIVLSNSGRLCAGAVTIGCTWLVGGGNGGVWCRSCQLTRTVPNAGDAEATAELAAVEAAKRRLVFQLDELGLPIGPDLRFDLLSSRFGPVTTGHHDGIITIDLAESDDAHREALRHQLGEPYRTVLGHLRHEIGHYYWPVVVDSAPELERYRELFGDERADYAAALDAHYESGPPDDWATRYVSAYATMHPWEDWAETFAHHLHILDTLETAEAFGIRAPLDIAAGSLETASFEAIVAEWLPLSYALNEVNRSMGRDDLYPFLLPPAVIAKLTFVHELMARLDHGKPPDRAMV
ncbi:MAG: hypothetical protein QOF97_1490 [Acidimicrobiaceae bacterium]